jgi:hypothetical protein
MTKPKNYDTDERLVAFDDEAGMARHKIVVWEEDSPYWNARVTVEIRTGQCEDDSASSGIVRWAAQAATDAARKVIESYRDGEKIPDKFHQR